MLLLFVVACCLLLLDVACCCLLLLGVVCCCLLLLVVACDPSTINISVGWILMFTVFR